MRPLVVLATAGIAFAYYAGVYVYRNYFSAERPLRNSTRRCEICKNSIATYHTTATCSHGHTFHTQCLDSLSEMGSCACPLCRTFHSS